MMVNTARRAAWALAVAALIVSGTGCVSSGSAEQTVRLVPIARPFEKDIPVPVGFRFMDSASEDRSTGERRLYLRHVYEGDAAKAAVRAFYREQMPLSRWVSISDGNVNGEYELRYEKESEVCTVVIRDRRGIRSGSEVQVVVSRK